MKSLSNRLKETSKNRLGSLAVVMPMLTLFVLMGAWLQGVIIDLLNAKQGNS